MRVVVAVLAFVLAHSAWGAAQQITTGTITGMVKDQQGLVLPAATVEVTNEQSAEVRQTIPNEDGAFSITALSQGRYKVKVTLDGFRAAEQQGVQLRSGEIFNAGTMVLQVGALTEATTVTAI